MRSLAAAAFLLLSSSSAARAAEPLSTPAERSAAQTLDANVLRAHVRFLASDLLEGRGPATRGDKLAQAYIASQLEALGLEPVGGMDGYLQPFDLVGVNGHPDRLEAKGGGKSLSLAFHDDFIAVAGEQEPTSALQASELVFVGYGIATPRTTRSSSPARRGSGTGAGTTSTRRPRRRAPRARSSSTPPRARATRGRWCRAPGPASSSACRTPLAPGSR
jgi:hypothetical protein